MKLLCPDCGKPIPSADTNVDTGIAKCPACGGVINVFQALGLPTPAASPVPAAPGAPAEEIFPRPPRMIVEDKGLDGWTARWRWFSPKYIFLTFFCVVWDGFLVFWYAMALSSKDHFAIVAILFPLLHVAVGVGLTYAVIAGYLNHTQITLDNAALTIRHGPVPWIGNCVLSNDAIEQLYRKRGTVQKNGQYTYHLWAALKGGGARSLLSLDTLDEVRFLEQQIEAKLGIPDQPMAGECRHD